MPSDAASSASNELAFDTEPLESKAVLKECREPAPSECNLPAKEERNKASDGECNGNKKLAVSNEFFILFLIQHSYVY